MYKERGEQSTRSNYKKIEKCYTEVMANLCWAFPSKWHALCKRKIKKNDIATLKKISKQIF